MILYNLLIERILDITNTKGKIWCRDGSFIDPSKFKESGKLAYGYMLDDKTAVRLTRSSGMEWSSKDINWYSTNLIKAYSPTDGVFNSSFLRDQSEFNPTNCPAIYYSCTQVNAVVTSYMPSVNELMYLYNSIMYGSMRTNLNTAGLYESCNYRIANISIDSDTSDDWFGIWSSSQYLGYSDTVWVVSYDGAKRYNGKCYYRNCVIPFFRIE